MTKRTYDRLTIARTQLDTALQLHEEGEDLFSVVTLAGAAEEILGQLLKAKQRAKDGGQDRDEPAHALDHLVSAVPKIAKVLDDEDVDLVDVRRRANFARNKFKHHDLGEPTTITLDLENEAVDMLTRAVDNYWHLTRDLTSSMRRFTEARRS